MANRKSKLSWITPHWPSVAIAMTSLGSELLSATFGLYYLKVFKMTYRIDTDWLVMAKIAFAIWNSLNDPIFGYFQDFGCCQSRWIQDRRRVIFYFSFPYALSYVLFWLPWYPLGPECLINSGANSTLLADVNNVTFSNITAVGCIPVGSRPDWLVGLHLLVSLVLFDTFASLVLPAQWALYAELGETNQSRARIVRYMSLARLIGTFSVAPVTALSDGLENFVNFQICNVVVAMIALLCFLYTALMTKPPKKRSCDDHHCQEIELEKDSNVSCCRTFRSALISTKQILTNRDFLSELAAAFLHVFRLKALQTNMVMLRDTLLTTAKLNSFNKPFFNQSFETLPEVLTFLVLTPLLGRFGAWSILMASLLLTCLNSVVTFALGRHNGDAILACLIINSITVQSTWPSVFHLFVADIAENDAEKHNRRRPLRTLIFTLNGLLRKPAISIAPITVQLIMSQSGYETYLSGPDKMSTVDKEFLFTSCFYILCFCPLILSVLEVIVLIPYRLKFRHRLDKVKEESQLEVELLQREKVTVTVTTALVDDYVPTENNNVL